MTSNSGRDQQPLRMSDEAAARLLARATELDSVRRAGTSVVDLREAAAEAGIAPEAFDQALREIHAAEGVPGGLRGAARGGTRRWLRVGAVLVALVLFAVVMRLVVPVPQGDREGVPSSIGTGP